jgi:predicted dehydrogenase
MKRITRRGFLKTGAAIAGAAVACRPVRRVAANERFTLGVIGLGTMGRFDMGMFLTQPEVQVVAVSDVDQARLDFGKSTVDKGYDNTDCATYPDFREIIGRKDIDAVLIATPDHWHALISIAAAQAGKNIYCEKPMSLTVGEGRIVADAMKRYKVVYQSGTQRRSIPCFRYAVDTARGGTLGKIHAVHTYLEPGHTAGPQANQPVPDGFDYERWLGQAPQKPYTAKRCHTNFRWIYDYSGGQLTDIGVHFNDLAQWGVDKDLTAPVEFEGTADFPPHDDLFNTPVRYHLKTKYADSLTLEMHDGSPRSVRFEGERGWICVDDDGKLTADPISLLDAAPTQREAYTAISYHQRNFIECVYSRKPTIAPPEVAHRSASVCHLANICLRLGGGKLEWDPETEKFKNSEAANAMLTRAQRQPWSLEGWDGKSDVLAASRKV